MNTTPVLLKAPRKAPKRRVSRWRSWYRLQTSEPGHVRPLAKAALRHVGIPRRTVALDLGCGTLNAVKHFLEGGFHKVVGVDMDPESLNHIAGLGSHREQFEFHQKAFHEFDFGQNRFDLVHADCSLPYAGREHIGKVVEGIKRSLTTEGIFVGLFFTHERPDQGNPDTIYTTKEEVARMLAPMNVSFEIDGLLPYPRSITVIASWL